MQPESQTRSPAVLWVMGAPVIGLLYVLSVGPAVRLIKDPAMLAVLEKIYAPLIFLYDHVHAVQGPLDWYMRFWQ